MSRELKSLICSESLTHSTNKEKEFHLKNKLKNVR
jgi:hypothetical protein